jgi:O-antigen ligase
MRVLIAIAGVSSGLAFLPPWAALAGVAGFAALPLAWYAFSVRWVPLFLAAVILLPPLPVPVGDTGPNVSVMVAGIGILAGLARLADWDLRLAALPCALLAYFGALWLSLGFALANSGAAVATGSAARVLLFGISVYVFFAVAQGPERAEGDARTGIARALFWVALVAAAFGCLDFALQFPAPAGFEPQFLWLESGVYRRAQGLFYEASTLGNFCAFFVVMAVVMLAQPKRARMLPPPLVWLGILIFAAAMVLSFSRASVLACGVAVAALALVERERWRKYRTLVGVVVALALLGGGLALLLPEVAGGYWARLDAVGNALETPDRLLSGRLEAWGRIGAFIADHPWQTVFGIGYKTLPYTEHLGRPVVADNVYLSTLVETGVVGLAALLGLNLAILAAGWRAAARGSFYGKWIFCFWVGEMFQMLSGDILTYWRVLPVYFWVLAQAFRDAYEGPADRSVR